MFPPAVFVVRVCFLGRQWALPTVSRLLEWMEAAQKYAQLDDQMARLEPYRAKYKTRGMVADDWTQPLVANAPTPTIDNDLFELFGI